MVMDVAKEHIFQDQHDKMLLQISHNPLNRRSRFRSVKPAVLKGTT